MYREREREREREKLDKPEKDRERGVEAKRKQVSQWVGPRDLRLALHPIN